MVRCSKSLLTTLFVASALCGCTYDFDRFAPGTLVTGQSVAVPDAESPSDDGGSPSDAQETTDVSSSPLDASTPGVVCADSQVLADGAVNPCPSLKQADGEPCDGAQFNRSCRYGRIICSCAPCSWACL